MSDFERVYTMSDFYDGPRGGIANFEGGPHVYSSVFDDLRDGYTDTFLLMPIQERLLQLALEDWKIWRRWEDAFHLGATTSDTHPTLPEDRARHEELARAIGDGLIAQPELSVRAYGEFRARPNAESERADPNDLEVRWTKIP